MNGYMEHSPEYYLQANNADALMEVCYKNKQTGKNDWILMLVVKNDGETIDDAAKRQFEGFCATMGIKKEDYISIFPQEKHYTIVPKLK